MLRPRAGIRALAQMALLAGLLATNAQAATSSGAATRLAQAPELDGRVQGDPAWANSTALTNFTQRQPNEGEPGTQRTNVYMGFTDDTLYVGVICFDDAPEEIIVANSSRDADLDLSDSFRMVFDTFRSQQNGLVFGTNPSGLQYDGQAVVESSSRFRSGDGFNLNFDTNWEVSATKHEFGWSAEFAIPFKSLRYGAEVSQTWGVNFQRNIRRTNEVSYWSPLPVQYALNRLSLAGRVSGIEVPPQRNLKFTPYALGRSTSGGIEGGTGTDSEFGFDVKYSLTPSLTLDATYNTDFAQVEADQQQINLNRFSLFFPEKRPFFLENSGQFTVGIPGSLELFFSRRIGIGPDGQQIPIVGGARVSGKIGQNTNVGFLAMRSEDVTGVIDETDFAVARVKQEFANRSYLGALVVNRDGDNDNQTYAIDGQWGIGENGNISGFVAKTSTNGIDDDDHALRIAGVYDAQDWSYRASYTEVGGGFNPEVGFLRRSNYRSVNLFGQRRIRKGESSSILELRPHAAYNGFWDFDGFYESGLLHIDSSIEWKSGADLNTAINFTHEGVRDDFEIVRGVNVKAGKYDHEEVSIFAGTDSSATWSFRTGFVAGGFFGGDRITASPSVTYRKGDTFRATLSVNHNNIDLPDGDFEINLTRLRMSYAFTPKFSVQALVQHNNRDEVLSTNLRLSWLQSANAGLFIVYNEVDDDLTAPGKPRREFILKYSYIFDVF